MKKAAERPKDMEDLNALLGISTEAATRKEELFHPRDCRDSVLRVSL
jgi:hypothetical protein